MQRENHILSVTAMLCISAYALIPITTQASDKVGEASAAQENSSKKEAAIDIAKLELAKQRDIDSATLKIISTEEHTWPDSSLGCGKPGQMYTQVLTPGFVVIIQSSKGTHELHATDQRAILCEHKLMLRTRQGVGAPLRNIEDMISTARNDLAGKLHVESSMIRTMNFIATEWPDSSMNCPVEGEAIQKQPLKGYRIALNHAGRTYVYHTDMTRVRACPAIEAQ